MINESAEHRYWGFLSTLFFTLVIILIGYAFQVLLAIFYPELWAQDIQSIASKDLSTTQSVNGFIWAIIICITAVVYILLVVGFIKIRRNNIGVKNYLKLNNVPIMAVMQWLGLLFILVSVLSLISFFIGRPFVDKYFLSAYFSAKNQLLFWCSVALIGPISEEVLFRGFLLEGLRQSKFGAVGAILISSFMWTIIHFQYDLYDLSQLFIIGLLMGMGKIYTKSLYTPIAIHSLMNLGVLINSAYYSRLVFH